MRRWSSRAAAAVRPFHPDAAWCSQCYLPRSAPESPSEAAKAVTAFRTVGSNQEAAAATRAAMVKTRWRKTPTTFGPVGRVLCTTFLVVMLAVLIVGTVVSGGLDIIGLGIWGFVIMPWALRDIWKAGSLPSG